MQNGNKSGRGCNKGKQCKLFPPPLCRSSINAVICLKNDCRYHHIKGTSFSNEDHVSNSVTASHVAAQQTASVGNISESRHVNKRSRPLPNQTSYANKVMGRQGDQQCGNQQHGESEVNGPQYSGIHSNFLELRHQIQQMQVQIQKFITSFPPPTVINKCHCRVECH